MPMTPEQRDRLAAMTNSITALLNQASREGYADCAAAALVLAALTRVWGEMGSPDTRMVWVRQAMVQSVVGSLASVATYWLNDPTGIEFVRADQEVPDGPIPDAVVQVADAAMKRMQGGPA